MANQYLSFRRNGAVNVRFGTINPTIIDEYDEGDQSDIWRHYYSLAELAPTKGSVFAYQRNWRGDVKNGSHIIVDFGGTPPYVKNTVEWYNVKTGAYVVDYYPEYYDNRDGYFNLLAGVDAKGREYSGFFITHLTIDDNINHYCYVKLYFKDELKGMYDDAIDGNAYATEESGSGGGRGVHDDTSDPIDFPALPTLSANDAGFCTVYTPSSTQLRNLSRYMWDADFFDSIVKLWADPMDVIMGLSVVPINVPTSGTQEVQVGNVSTGVSMNVATGQWHEVDCGTLNIQEYFGAYLDYSPYTKISIYLPYCGTYDLSVEEIMGKSLHLKYHVDILSGACIAFLKVGSSILYAYQGNVAVSMPISGENWRQAFQTAVSMVTDATTAVASGGLASADTLVSAAVNSTNLKPSIQHSGAFGGSAGAMGVQYPYLIIQRPRACIPAEQSKYQGYPAFIAKKLSDVKGYTEVDSVVLDGIECTDEERKLIYDLLKTGVYL